MKNRVDKVVDVSHANLSLTDYQWLADVIKSSSLVETIKLPEISDDDAESVLAILSKATVCNSTLTKMEVNFSGKTHKLSASLTLMHQKIKSRLQRNKKKIFGIHGGGCIGLGLLADIISKSSYSYDILATSSNELLRDLVNNTNKLWLQHGGT